MSETKPFPYTAGIVNSLTKHIFSSFFFKDKCIFNQVKVNGIMTLLTQWVTPSVMQWDFVQRYELRGVWTQTLENKGHTFVNKKYPHFHPLYTITHPAPSTYDPYITMSFLTKQAWPTFASQEKWGVSQDSWQRLLLLL